MILSRRLALGLAGAALAAPLARAANPLICGAALPFSGADALQGDEIWRGIQLAAAAVNLPGPGALLLSADMPDPADATAAVNGLITANHAAIMFGSGDSSLSYPASAAAELAQTPFIELSAPADGITSRGFKFLLRIAPSTQMAAQLAAQTVQQRFSGRSLGLLYNTGNTGGAFAAAMMTAFAAAKIPVTLAAGYPEGVEDLHDEAGRLMRAKVDVLIHAGGPDEALGLALAAKTLGWQPGVLIGYGTGYRFREMAVAPQNGTFVIAAPDYAAASMPVHDAYLARYGTPPRAADSLTAYAGAKLVFDTLNGVNGDAAKLLAALRQANLPRGALANGFGVQFDRNGQNTAAFVTLQQWHGGVLAQV